MARFTTAGSVHAPGGFSYIAVLFTVLLLSLALVIAAEPIATTSQRDKEAELLFIGEQYRNAIASYYKSAPDGLSVLPTKLEDLVLDKRYIAPKRHLRKLYADPITASQAWGLIKNPQDQLMGVYSQAAGIPLLMKPDIANVEGTTTAPDTGSGTEKLAMTSGSQTPAYPGSRWAAPAKTASYADWKFVFVPNQQNAELMSNSGELTKTPSLDLMQ